MSTVSVRYIVTDIEKVIAFYTEHLGFQLDIKSDAGFAVLTRGNLRLLLNMPGAGGASEALPDGLSPTPGGWNRFQLEINDLGDLVERLKQKGATFRNEIVIGRGGKQILLEDPVGNPIELFEPTQS